MDYRNGNFNSLESRQPTGTSTNSHENHETNFSNICKYNHFKLNQTTTNGGLEIELIENLKCNKKFNLRIDFKCEVTRKYSRTSKNKKGYFLFAAKFEEIILSPLRILADIFYLPQVHFLIIQN